MAARVPRRGRSGRCGVAGLFVFLVVPALVGAQNRPRLFIEAGPSADFNTSPFSVSGFGGTVGAGVLITPAWSISVNVERAQLRFNDASWSSYAARIGRLSPPTERVRVAWSAGIGVMQSEEFRRRTSLPALTLEGSLPIRMTSQLSIAPQVRGHFEFGDEDAGLVTVIGVGVRWEHRP